MNDPKSEPNDDSLNLEGIMSRYESSGANWIHRYASNLLFVLLILSVCSVAAGENTTKQSLRIGQPGSDSHPVATVSAPATRNGWLPNAPPGAHRAPMQAGSRARLVETYGKLPLSFEANQGQTDGQVKFLSRGRGYGLFLTANEAVLTLRKVAREQDSKIEARKSVLSPDP